MGVFGKKVTGNAVKVINIVKFQSISDEDREKVKNLKDGQGHLIDIMSLW